MDTPPNPWQSATSVGAEGRNSSNSRNHDFGGSASSLRAPADAGGNSDASLLSSRATDGQGENYHAIVKNTFLEAFDTRKQNDTLRRSASDSDLSCSSGEDKLKFWLPSLSSQSSQTQSNSSEHKLSYAFGEKRAEPSTAAGSVAVEAFGLPSLCNAVSASGAPPFAGGCYGVAPVTSSASDHRWHSDARGTPVAAGPLLATGVPYSGVASGWPAPVPAALSTYEPADYLVEQIHRETGHPMSDLQVLQQQGVLHQIPRNDGGELSSVGSLGHAAGDCSPCLFWYNKSCTKSVSCSYCHFKHKGQKKKRIRPSRKTRLQLKIGTAGSDDEFDEDDGGAEQDAKVETKFPASGRSRETTCLRL